MTGSKLKRREAYRVILDDEDADQRGMQLIRLQHVVGAQRPRNEDRQVAAALGS